MPVTIGMLLAERVRQHGAIRGCPTRLLAFHAGGITLMPQPRQEIPYPGREQFPPFEYRAPQSERGASGRRRSAMPGPRDDDPGRTDPLMEGAMLPSPADRAVGIDVRPPTAPGEFCAYLWGPGSTASTLSIAHLRQAHVCLGPPSHARGRHVCARCSAPGSDMRACPHRVELPDASGRPEARAPERARPRVTRAPEDRLAVAATG